MFEYNKEPKHHSVYLAIVVSYSESLHSAKPNPGIVEVVVSLYIQPRLNTTIVVATTRRNYLILALDGSD